MRMFRCRSPRVSKGETRNVECNALAYARASASMFTNMHRDDSLLQRLQPEVAGLKSCRLYGNCRHELEKTPCSNTVFYNQMDADCLKAKRSYREFSSSRISVSALAVCGRGPKSQRCILFKKGQTLRGALQPNKIRRCAAFRQGFASRVCRPANPAFVAVSALPDRVI